MKIKLLFSFICFAFLLTSCGDFKKTKSGAMYKIHTSKGGKKPKMGDVIQIHFQMKTANDSVFQSSYKVVDRMSNGKPQYLPIKEGFMYRGIMESFMEMGEGDSATIKFIGDSLFTNPASRPPFVKSKEIVKIDVKLLKVLTEAEYRKQAEAEMNKMKEEQVGKDEETIKKYIADNKLNATRTASGLYYIIETEGKGDVAKPGDSLGVYYKGMLTTGEVFDTNMGDEKKGEKKKEPFGVVVGVSQVIQGWHEGLSHFKKGGKGKIIIPSGLGYGPRGGGPIPANSVLIFDIEIASLTAKKK